MKLTSSHLKYLLAIYEIAKETPEASSSGIARKLSVSKPSVSTMLVSLQERGFLVKERYGLPPNPATAGYSRERQGNPATGRPPAFSAAETAYDNSTGDTGAFRMPEIQLRKTYFF